MTSGTCVWLTLLQGNILYRFPSLQRTAVDWLGRRKDPPKGETEGLFYFAENRWNFRLVGLFF